VGDDDRLRLTDQEERRLASGLFNEVWSLLEKPSRTTDEDDRMLHAAHASRLHWDTIGEPANFAIGEWQCSRVYSVLGRAEPALHHANRMLDICDQAGIAGYLRATAFEALARASFVAGDRDAGERARDAAWAEAAQIDDPEDREVFERDMASLPT
jgi:hypothetical protein